jgi:hypothetical protein
MRRCQACGKEGSDNSKFCDECGSRLPVNGSGDPAGREVRPQAISNPNFRASSITSVGIPPLVEPREQKVSTEESRLAGKGHARLVIERGEAANTEFMLAGEESNIGRWDADNGIFPDVDLDAHDPDAKVSRRHARIIHRDDTYMIEDLGSTNGTFVNRGRRLLPGSPQPLNEGDEIIVGKTFMRFFKENSN